MISKKTLKLLSFDLVSTVVFFGISFFIMGSIFTGLGSYTYDYNWFFKRAYAIHPSFVLVIAVISVVWTGILMKTISRLKSKKAIFCFIQIFFSATVVVLAICKTIAYDGWWPHVIALLKTNWEVFLAVGVLSLLFLPATIILGIMCFYLKLSELHGRE